VNVDAIVTVEFAGAFFHRIGSPLLECALLKQELFKLRRTDNAPRPVIKAATVDNVVTVLQEVVDHIPHCTDSDIVDATDLLEGKLGGREVGQRAIASLDQNQLLVLSECPSDLARDRSWSSLKVTRQWLAPKEEVLEFG